jgi:alpha,alpha-trehalase
MKISRRERIKSALVSTTGALMRPSKSPDEALGELFHDVQKARMYEDGMTFVDLIPRRRMKQIKQEYLLEKQDPNFDLRDFVARHFYKYGAYEDVYHTDPTMDIREHIRELWHVLERKNRRDRGSLIALPNSYIVPGGRFACQFYWDSYFIMLGLAADNRWDMIEGMVKNYAFMIRKFGFIPTANRTYFVSRSQPPFFSRMVKLLAKHKGRNVTLIEYLPYLLIEYRFWMKGRKETAKHEFSSYARVAKMPNGVLLNRYYDNKSTPRPESLFEDTETAEQAMNREPDRLFLHLRAAAESGWDFSSRWFSDPEDLRTIHTADIIPIDLNCLLYELELTIAEAYRVLRQSILAQRFQTAAEQRAKTLQAYCWNEEKQFFMDYNFHEGAQTKHLTLAGMFPLYARMATSAQAAAIAKRLENEFLKPGGLVTTIHNTGQQWDSPNGWAPLQWVAIEGLRNYGYYELANLIKERWISTNLKLFKEQAKLVEKYDVVTGASGGGGEYPLQDGFGWTNGVLAALLAEEKTNSAQN